MVYVPYLYTILGLLSTLYTTRTPPSTFASSSQFADLVINLATAIDGLESKTHTGKEATKDVRFRRKMCVRVWRGLREIREVLPQVLDVLLKKTVPVPSRLTVLLGHVVGVALRLKPSPKSQVPEGRALIEENKVCPLHTAHSGD